MPTNFRRKSLLKRICVFSYFDKNGIIEDYVILYLEGLKKVVDKIIFVSACNPPEAELKKIQKLVENYIIIKNLENDFMNWKTGILNIGWETLQQYDELIIANDSCYAPLFPFQKLFDSMQGKKCDFWGITDCYSYSYHLQSYFLVFKRNVFISDVFKNFWNSVQKESSKQSIITKYEVGLSTLLLKNHFLSKTYIEFNIFFIMLLSLRYKYFRVKNILLGKGELVEYDKINWINKIKAFLNPFNTNTVFMEWERIIKKHSPFLKVKLLKNNPFDFERIKKWEEVLRKEGIDYDFSAIQKHLSRG